jgi:hypothetical protein
MHGQELDCEVGRRRLTLLPSTLARCPGARASAMFSFLPWGASCWALLGMSASAVGILVVGVCCVGEMVGDVQVDFMIWTRIEYTFYKWKRTLELLGVMVMKA